MIRFLVQFLLVCVVFIAAWRGGGKPERYVASIYLAMLLAASIHAFIEKPFEQADFEKFIAFRSVLDVAALVGVVFVALRYDRWWTLWVGSAQFLAVMAHMLRAWDMPIAPIVYAVMERWPVWIAVALTGLGTLLYRRRNQVTAIDT